MVAAAVGLALLSVWKSAAQRDERELPEATLPAMSWDVIKSLVPPALTIAILGAIESLLSATVAAGVIGDHADEEMPRLELNGRDYIGLIELPEYGVSLPVAADWDTGLFPFRPACYSGTLYSGTLVIGGSGGEDCFVFISQLDAGECVMFTDARGVRYAFTVSRITHHAALGAAELDDPESSLLLFVKTGRTYLLAHCVTA